MKPTPIHGPAPLSGRTITIALVVALVQFMQMLDGSIISIALPPIAVDFGVNPVSVGFGITVYVLAASIVIPTSAWLADRIGARTILVIAVAGFAASSALSGLADALWQFIGARALQGISGALMAPVGRVILLRSVDRSQLLRVMNLTSAPMLVAPVIGPPLGGLLTTWLGWPWIFYINLPVSVLTIVLSLRWLPNPRGARRPFDVIGFLLNAAALTPLLWSLSELDDAAIPRPLIVGAICLGGGIGAFALRHAQRAANPLLSLRPLRHRSFRLTSGSSTIFTRLPIQTLVFVLPILLQTGFGMSALLSGLLFLGHSGGDLSMKLFTTRVFRSFGYRTVLLACLLGIAVTIAGCAFFRPATPLAVIAGLLFVAGCFRSFMMTGLSTLAFSEIEPAEMSDANTLNQVVGQLSTAVSVSAASLLFDVARLARGAGEGPPTPADCRIALVVMATIALLAMFPLRRLSPNAGSALSGHPAVLPPRPIS